jgi:EAL domain-containing protein (putative c-di-GMP-specific phosphodiesterase class I)
VRGVDADPVRRAIVGHTARLMDELGVRLVCEGIETAEELSALEDLGVRFVQGYFLARPAFQALPPFGPPEISGTGPKRRAL